MKRSLILLFSIISLVCCFSPLMAQLHWISSTDNEKWMQQKDINLLAYNPSSPADVVIYKDQPQQQIDGWGGCFNELGWKALELLDVQKRNEVLRAFFDPTTGLKYNICRMPIGASDYALDWYSLNETPNDFDMKNFSIERDKKLLIPYIKAAMQFNPALKIWGSPWSPPTWMKITNHYACRPTPENNMNPSTVGIGNANQFILKEQYLKAYALYFSKYIKAYQQEGINVYAVHAQNEPYHAAPFPGCTWTADALGGFISKYLAPTFKKQGLKTAIWFGTINNGDAKVFDTVLANTSVINVIEGVGFQWAGKNAIAEINRKYPALKKMQTETECGDGRFNWAAAEYTFSLIKYYMNNGVNSYMYWNMILDETGKSSWGWKQNAQVIINQKTKEITYTPEFYLIKHFSSFVVPGSVKVMTDGAFGDVLVFQQPNKKIVIVAANTSSSEKMVTIKMDGQIFSAALQPNSFNTFFE